MCTVVFIPGKDEMQFASLRDESPKRPLAIPPHLCIENDISFLAPKDPFAGGTWIGVNEFQNVIVLLNGAFENHLKIKSYSKSRGLIVAELLKTEMPVIDWSILDLVNVEPFTLVIWSDNNLFELVWDGEKKHRKILNQKVPHIWSSSTLYDYQAKENRKVFFDNWIAMEPPITKLSLLNLFKSFNNNQNGFIIDRNENLKTLSYSFLSIHKQSSAVFDYFDFKEFSHHQKKINFRAKNFEWPMAINQ